MTNYCALADCVDVTLVVEPRHVEAANVYVEVVLQQCGITPSAVTLPNALLTQIAMTYAKRQAAIDNAIGENSPLIDKARQLKTTLDMLVAGVTKSSLGIVDSAVSYATVQLGRA